MSWIWRMAVIACLALTCVLLGMSIRISFDWLTLSGSEPQLRPDEIARLRGDLAGVEDPFAPVIKVAALVQPSVVSIDVLAHRTDGLGFLRSTYARGGSGVILDAEGHILTNGHVVEDKDRIEVRLADGRRFSGAEVELVGHDLESDLAVLRIRAKGIVPIELADSDRVEVGQAAIAVGSPFNLEGTVTLGMVSSKARRISTGEARAFDVESYIQTDAAINPGNSGGALVDIHGQLIGINTMIVTQTSAGVGFAIPSNFAARIARQIIETGSVPRGGIGVWFPDRIDPTALGFPAGAFVQGVYRGAAADRAGIAPRDVIVRFDGEEVSDYDTLLRLVRKTPPGKTIPIVIFRENGYRELMVTIGNRKDLERFNQGIQRGSEGSRRQ